ncbi:MAG: dihydrodipicolinate synthase family protein [Acidobacteriaceae bacterium]|nr:dihydrodipicolinate synthase family protein [Acidobacteriaceae bacterium]
MMLIDGIHVPLATPFYRDGALYLRKLEHNVRRYSLTPAAGLVLFAPGAEGTSLSDAEVAECLSAVRETAAAEKVLVCAITRDSVAQALSLAQQAYDAMFDAVLLAAPTSWSAIVRRTGERELLNYFRTVADNSPLPVLLWSDAAAPSRQLSVEAVGLLAQHPNILGLYDGALAVERLGALRAATSGVAHDATVTHIFRPVTRRMLAPVAEVAGESTFVSAEALLGGAGTSVALAPAAPAIKTRTKKLGFAIMACGASSEMLPILEAGANGAMPALAAPAPQGVHEAYAAFTDGNLALAREKAARLVAADAVLAELGPAGTKYACDLNGYFGGFPRLPLAPADAAEQKRVEAAFRELKN